MRPQNQGMSNSNLERWHELVRSKDMSRLDDVLADDVVFHSPVVHTPQEGKALTKMYLSAALGVLGEGFTYVREIANEREAMLEFTVEIEGIHVNGVDIIRWNDEGRIVDFKVLIRPLKAIQLVHRLMGEALKQS